MILVDVKVFLFVCFLFFFICWLLPFTCFLYIYVFVCTVWLISQSWPFNVNKKYYYYYNNVGLIQILTIIASVPNSVLKHIQIFLLFHHQPFYCYDQPCYQETVNCTIRQTIKSVIASFIIWIKYFANNYMWLGVCFIFKSTRLPLMSTLLLLPWEQSWR